MIVELRQYELQPGARETLIELFDRELVETQEAEGMAVIGQFRDLDGPDRFVWVRGFPDLESRAASLAAFYGGPVWREHREVANATMIDSDNVLLLRPAREGSGFAVDARDRSPVGSTATGEIVTVVVYHLRPGGEDGIADLFDREIRPAVAGAEVLATFVTHPGPNTFPALPVRENENVFAWFARGELERLDVPDELDRRFTRAPEVLRLAPTARSLV